LDRKLFLYILLILLLLSACSSKKQVNFKLTEIDSYKISKKYLPEIGMIFMDDFDKEKKVIFTSKGWLLIIKESDFKIIEKIKLKKGKGPGEYNNITGVFIKNNNIYLYDHTLKRFLIIKYDKNLKVYDTANLDIPVNIGVTDFNDKFAINTFRRGKKGNVDLYLTILDNKLKTYSKILIDDISFDNRKEIVNTIGWPLINNNKIYYTSMGNGQVKIFEYKSGKFIDKFYNSNKEQHISYKHPNVNVLPPVFIMRKYLLIVYNNRNNKKLKNKLYYEIFDKRGNLLDEGITNINFRTSNNSFSFQNDFFYCYDSENEILKVYEYQINK